MSGIGSFAFNQKGVIMQAGTDSEIIELAISKEQQDIDFYMDLSDRMEDPLMKDVFKTLSDEEREHKELLELELMKLGRVVGPREFDFDWMEPEIDSVSLEGIGYLDALELAIDREEADFRMYSEMAVLSRDGEAKNMLFELAQQEVIHKLRLQSQYNLVTEDESGESEE
jgi:rubrerythrin